MSCLTDGVKDIKIVSENYNEFLTLNVFRLSGGKDVVDINKKFSEVDLTNPDAIVSTTQQLVTAISNLEISDAKDNIISGDMLVNRNPIDKKIYLPQPASISETITHVYNDKDMPVEKMLTKVAGAAPIIGGAVTTTMDVLENHITRTGMNFDPRIVNSYIRTNVREISLNFILRPHNQDDANKYIKMINCLKDVSKARRKKVLGIMPVLEQDHVVTMDFDGPNNGKLNELFNLGANKSFGFFLVEVISTIEDKGRSLQYSDGMPKKIMLTLKLSERRPLYSNFWGEVPINKPKTSIIDTTSDNISENQTMDFHIYSLGYHQRDIFKAFDSLETSIKAITTALKKDGNDIDIEATIETIEKAMGDDYKNIKEAITSGGDIGAVIGKALKKKLDQATEPTLINKGKHYTIKLPLPNSIIDSLGHSYGSSELSVADKLTSRVASVGATALIGWKASGISDTVTSAVEIDKRIGTRNNFTTNPNILTVYEGTTLKSYTFEYNIVPQNAKEADNIIEAIRIIKLYASGSTATSGKMKNAFLTMSGVFNFNINKKYDDILELSENKFYYITNLTLSPGTSDYINKFKDGMPKVITFSIALQARLPEYYE